MTDPLGGLAPEEHPSVPEPPEEAPPQRPRRPFAPTTWALLALLAIAFAAEGLVARDPAVESSVALMRLGALFVPAVRDGDWWRIGSYAFLHIGWLHIAMNAYALYILAPQLEGTYGSNATLGMFAGTAIAGGGASMLWAILRGGIPPLAAGASGGIFGLFGATVALAWRLRHRIPPQARKSVFRRIVFNLLLNVAIAFTFPVDSAAHAGGLLSGFALGLLASLPTLPWRPWHLVTKWFLIGSAFALAAMEGAAVARAGRPHPRTLHADGLVAQVPGLFVPVEPGVAEIPGAAALVIARADQPLRLPPGTTNAIRIGDRTWVRKRVTEDGVDVVYLTAAEGEGSIGVRFECNAAFCRGSAGDRIYEQVARTVQVVP